MLTPLQVACFPQAVQLNYSELLNAPRYLRQLSLAGSEQCTIDAAVKSDLLCFETTRVTVQNKLVCSPHLVLTLD